MDAGSRQGRGPKLVPWEVKVKGRALCGSVVTGDVVFSVSMSEPLDRRSSVQLVLRTFSSYRALSVAADQQSPGPGPLHACSLAGSEMIIPGGWNLEVSAVGFP